MYHFNRCFRNTGFSFATGSVGMPEAQCVVLISDVMSFDNVAACHVAHKLLEKRLSVPNRHLYLDKILRLAQSLQASRCALYWSLIIF